MSGDLLPLDRIRLDWEGHRAALRWIGILYRKPKAFKEAEERLAQLQRLPVLFRLYLHALPCLILLSVIIRLVLSRTTGLDWQFAKQLALGLSGGLVFCLVIGNAFRLAVGLAVGLAAGLAVSLAGDLAGALSSGLAGGLAFGLAFGLAGDLVGGLGLGLGLGLFGSLQSDSPEDGSAFGWYIGFFGTYFRLYCLPIHAFVLLRGTQPGLFRFHPVAWDDVYLLPFPGLDRVLVRYSEHDPAAGKREIERLIDTRSSQRDAALRARVILVAREAADIADLARLDDVLAALPEGKQGFLQETHELRRRAHEITALQARIDTLDRPFLREPFAGLLVKEIEGFEGQIAGFRQPLSTEFREAARNWLEIARKQHETARAAVAREPTRQVFRAGDPVDREREAFVERAGILGELERQVMLASGCPGLLVYGRRRVGKSSLLKNLEGFLPPRVSIVNLSMQEARAFASLSSWIGLLAERISGRLPGISLPASQDRDLRDLARLLDETEERLETEDSRLLLALDEYENLDRKIGEGVFSEDFLAVLRESMQSHRHLIWTLAGSHRIDELTHAPWASYLVSARTVEVPPFEPAETRLLLTEPLKHSSLWRAAGSEAPRFEPGFWGAGGIERIQAETGGWPHLVQLVAERVVDLVNDGGVGGADERLLDRALDRAVENGYSVFLEVVERESALPGELAYLRRFAREETLPIPEDDAVDRSLRRRLLVVPEGDRYRLRAPIMARWLRRA